MSGHSKWATTKRAKAVTDAARSRIFTKLTKLITVAARHGGGDPTSNVQLRFAVDKARAANVPRDNIERAIKRGTGELGGAVLEEFTYEAVGPSGTALVIEGVTDSKNRTHSELRNLLEQHGGKLAEPGSQRWQFSHVGLFTVPVPAGKTSDDVELAAADAGADDTQVGEEGVEVVTPPDAAARVRTAMSEAGFAASPPGFRFIPKNVVELEAGAAATARGLVEALLDHDDVQAVAANFV
ncbi:MAG: YebC/PmpR family DNA-binding transcriptional regulator [Candidatus Andersenbacteria bacterium]